MTMEPGAQNQPVEAPAVIAGVIVVLGTVPSASTPRSRRCWGCSPPSR
jgi:hypothetical protein